MEGHFGTAVVSYFVFLRWLFLMNLLIFLLWFGLAVIPQLVWVSGTNAPRTPSTLACVFPLNTSVFPLNTSGPPLNCSDGGPPIDFLLSGPPTSGDLDKYVGRLLCRGGEAGEEGKFDVGSCQFESRENGTQVADREDPDRSRSVSDLTSCSNITESVSQTHSVAFLPDILPSAFFLATFTPTPRFSSSLFPVFTFLHNSPSNYILPPSPGSFTGVDYYYMCTGVNPVVPWYQHIFDFALGRGVFNDTVLFQGRYTNETVELVSGTTYNLPFAYILLTGAVFLISVVLLVYK